MTEERMMILQMLQAGKLTAEEAGRLLAALGESPAAGRRDDPAHAEGSSARDPAQTPPRSPFADVDLTGVNLRGAKLEGADLKNVDLVGANLCDADLTNAILTGASLTGANLNGANLAGADLTDADLTGVPLPGVNLSGLNLRGISLCGACLGDLDLMSLLRSVGGDEALSFATRVSEQPAVAYSGDPFPTVHASPQ